ADKARTIRMPVHIVERLQKMNRAERTLWTQLGREPTLEEIAEEASLPLQQVLEVKAAARASASLDQPGGEHEAAVVRDVGACDAARTAVRDGVTPKADPSNKDDVRSPIRSRARR